MGARITITAITRGRGATKRRRIFADGDPLCETSFDVVTRLGLSEGDEWDEDDLNESIEGACREIARSRALALLGFRDRSPFELRTRLLEEGLTPSAVGAAVELLLTEGYLDELRFAESLARVLVETRGRGRERVRRELEQRGIAADALHAALEECCPEDAEGQRALSLARRLAPTAPDPQKLAGRLVRRGFSVHVSIDAASAAIEENTS